MKTQLFVMLVLILSMSAVAGCATRNEANQYCAAGASCIQSTGDGATNSTTATNVEDAYATGDGALVGGVAILAMIAVAVVFLAASSTENGNDWV